VGEKRYKIGEAAKRLGVSTRTLRYYEEEGLLTPFRAPKGTRYYTDAHLERLAAIIRLSRAGLGMEAIRTIASAREGCATGDDSSRKVRALLDSAERRLQRKAEEITELIKEIRAAKQVVERCNGCRNKPDTRGCPECPVISHLGDIGVLNVIWDE
jgi:DNA-binding transcriptional MerR regulator